MSDAAVAAALGLGASYDPATDVAVLAPPVPTGKIGVHGHSSSGDGRNNGKRWKGLPAPREGEMDERLYAHAANMSTSAIRWGADPFHTLLKHHGQHQQHQRNPNLNHPSSFPSASELCVPGSARRSCLLYKMRRAPRYFVDRTVTGNPCSTPPQPPR